jgi:hypothetical protein
MTHKHEETIAQTEAEKNALALDTMRRFLLTDLNKKYLELIAFMRTFPFHPSQMHQAFIFLDTGMLWAKETIQYGMIYSPPVAPEVATAAQGEEEVKTEVVLN